jgi:RimJ/RimL family protein N-acetyltransferase
MNGGTPMNGGHPMRGSTPVNGGGPRNRFPAPDGSGRALGARPQVPTQATVLAPALAPSAPSPPHRLLPGADLLDGVGSWGTTPTPVGQFRLQPVRLPRDLALITRWMNDPVVTAFWELAGPAVLTERHLREQLDGDGRSAPCLGLLDGTPMSYWEIYRADLDPLARHYPARPHDTGVHLLLGPADCRGRGLGPILIQAVAELVLTHRQTARRVVAEPDIRNIPSIRAFLRAGFRHRQDLALPAKHAALMLYDRH